MNAHIQPLAEITQKATSVLIRAIGVVDTIRFLNQFRAGAGNYTTEREHLFERMSVKDIVDDIKAQNKMSA